MSSVVVVTPLIVAGWPVITAAVTAAVASMGFTVVRAHAPDMKAEIAPRIVTKTKAEIEIEDSEVLQTAVATNELVVEKDGVRATFSRDARGALKLCMEGESVSKAELQRIGH